VRGVALHWFTSDLRVDDNPALAAGAEAGAVLGVYVLDPAVLRRHADATRRLAFMAATLQALDARLRARGSRLVVLEGRASEELPPLAGRVGARVVSGARNYEPGALERERRVQAALSRAGVEVRLRDAAFVHAPGTIVKDDGTPYRVFGAFARAWSQRGVREPAAAPRAWVATAELDGVGIACPLARIGDLLAAGEDAARDRLRRFLQGTLVDYEAGRDRLDADGTSRLSHHFRWGSLSAAEAWRRATAAGARSPALARAAQAWVRQLAWRDFFAHLLAAEPRLAREPMHPLPIRWRHDEPAFRRWQTGQTGIPLVDAGMRELAATGLMHNRARMVAASFLTRQLLLDWRDGERHFMTELLDGQLAQNDGNWQWIAGTGADAQPFHRIFSPVRQGERFDPQGAYVRRWVPELRRVPARHVHQPWSLPPLERRGLCPDYPPPVVDLDAARARALAAFERARPTSRGPRRR
jgi:deoxyribodipyrimidine photo-lyase